MAVNVLIKKSPGGLKDVGFLTLETVRVNGVSEAMGNVAGRVILIAEEFTRLHKRLALTKGAVIPQVDDTLGKISGGNSTTTTELTSITALCLMVNW